MRLLAYNSSLGTGSRLGALLAERDDRDAKPLERDAELDEHDEQIRALPAGHYRDEKKTRNHAPEPPDAISRDAWSRQPGEEEQQRAKNHEFDNTDKRHELIEYMGDPRRLLCTRPASIERKGESDARPDESAGPQYAEDEKGLPFGAAKPGPNVSHLEPDRGRVPERRDQSCAPQPSNSQFQCRPADTIQSTHWSRSSCETRVGCVEPTTE